MTNEQTSQQDEQQTENDQFEQTNHQVPGGSSTDSMKMAAVNDDEDLDEDDDLLEDEDDQDEVTKGDGDDIVGMDNEEDVAL